MGSHLTGEEDYAKVLGRYELFRLIDDLVSNIG